MGANARDKILETVIALLVKKTDMNTVTNRQIAALAGVNSALINYYFNSKENLLNMAVGICMGNIFEEIVESSAGDLPPIDRLKNMVKAIAEVAFANYNLAEIAFAHDMKKGSLNTTQMILPLLKEVYSNSKTETELKLLGLQIVVPLQLLFLNVNDYKNYLLCDLYDSMTRNELIEKMVDNIFLTEVTK